MVVEVVFTGLSLFVYPGGAGSRPTAVEWTQGSPAVQVWLVETEHKGSDGELHRHVPRLTFRAEQYWSGLEDQVVEAARQADGDLVLSLDLTGAELEVGPAGDAVVLDFPSKIPDLAAPAESDRSALDFLLPMSSLGLTKWVANPREHVVSTIALHGGEVLVRRLARMPAEGPDRPLMTAAFTDGKRALAEQFVWRFETKDDSFAIRREGGDDIVLVPDTRDGPVRITISNVPVKAKMAPPSWGHLAHYDPLFEGAVQLPKTSALVSNNSTGCPPGRAPLD